MSYNPAIPQITDQLLQSQAQIRANFQSINIAFSNNHFSLVGDQDFQGMHNVLTMRPQSLDAITDATHVGFYNKLVSSIPELFFRPNNNQTPIQLTFPALNTDMSSLTQFSFVAGAFVVYMGKIVNPTNGQTVTLTPTTTLRYVGLNAANVNSTAQIKVAIPTNITGSSFNISHTITVPPQLIDVYYLAIGN